MDLSFTGSIAIAFFVVTTPVVLGFIDFFVVTTLVVLGFAAFLTETGFGFLTAFTFALAGATFFPFGDDLTTAFFVTGFTTFFTGLAAFFTFAAATFFAFTTFLLFGADFFLVVVFFFVVAILTSLS